MTSQQVIQLGKKGLTQELLKDIQKRFEKLNLENIKISILRNARENREDIKKYAEEILNFLGKKYSYRILGFNIFLKKWRKMKN